jgi:hypothetical protein
MDFLSQLWVPILVSAVAVWFVSFLMHMVIPIHKGDFKGLPDEDKVLDAIRGVPAGDYMFPYCKPEQMKDPDMKAKMERGPIGILTVWPGQVNMGQNLIVTLLFYVLVGVFVAYIGWHGLAGNPAAGEYLERFRMTGAVAFAAHGLGWMSYAIWYRNIRFWPNFIDSVIYALVTAGIFAAMWPK